MVEVANKFRVPVRIPLVGGGTDVPPFCEQVGGCAITATITRYTYIEFEESCLDDTFIKIGGSLYRVGVDAYLGQDVIEAAIKRVGLISPSVIRIAEGLTKSSGLGSSSSLAVGMIGGLRYWNGQVVSKREIAAEAVKLERDDLKIPGGYMDQYSAALGGINFMQFAGREVTVTPLEVSSGIRKELEARLLLCYIGDKATESHQLTALVEGMQDPQVWKALEELKKLTIICKQFLESGDLDSYGHFLNRIWDCKKRYNPLMSNPSIDEIYQTVIRCGATGAKVVGSGGGGYLMVYCHPKARSPVSRALVERGGIISPFRFESGGFVANEDFCRNTYL